MVKFPDCFLGSFGQLGRRGRFLRWLRHYESVLDQVLSQCLLQDPDIQLLLGLGTFPGAYKQERTVSGDGARFGRNTGQRWGVKGESESESEGEGWQIRGDGGAGWLGKDSFPQSTHVRCMQELGCIQRSNALPQLLAGAGGSPQPPLRRAANTRGMSLQPFLMWHLGKEPQSQPRLGFPRVPWGSPLLLSHGLISSPPISEGAKQDASGFATTFVFSGRRGMSQKKGLFSQPKASILLE